MLVWLIVKIFIISCICGPIDTTKSIDGLRSEQKRVTRDVTATRVIGHEEKEGR